MRQWVVVRELGTGDADALEDLREACSSDEWWVADVGMVGERSNETLFGVWMGSILVAAARAQVVSEYCRPINIIFLFFFPDRRLLERFDERPAVGVNGHFSSFRRPIILSITTVPRRLHWRDLAPAVPRPRVRQGGGLGVLRVGAPAGNECWS